MATSTSTSRIILSFLCLLLLTTAPSLSTTSSSSTSNDSSSSSSSSSGGGIESFIQCFLNLQADSSSQLLYTSNSNSYQSILRSSAQNLRFLLSQTNHKPAVIVTPTLETHVSESVLCARQHGIRVRVRSGGHDYEAMSYVSEEDTPFVLVDLATLRSVNVDVPSGTAWVQAGATVGELYYSVSTASKGRFGFPAGTCPTVGLGGQISGGGQGMLLRKFGLAADNVIDARVVGVDGRILNRTKMGEDLFWAIRGSGAVSFGVVVAYELRLVEVPPLVTVFNVIRNLEQNATELVTRWQEIVPNIDNNLFLRVIAMAKITDGSVNMKVMFNSLFLGNRRELLSLMAKSFPELGLRANDTSEISWIESTLGELPKGGGIGALLNRTSQYINTSFKSKSDYVNKPIAREGWDKIWKFIMEGKEHPMTILLEPYGGRMSEIPASATPFPHRKGNLYNIQYFTRWNGTDAAVAQRHVDWMRKLYTFMTPYVSSNPRAAYYNYKDIDLAGTSQSSRTPTNYTEAQVWGNKYFKDNFKRLASVKARVDPENFFRNEQSIPPLLSL